MCIHTGFRVRLFFLYFILFFYFFVLKSLSVLKAESDAQATVVQLLGAHIESPRTPTVHSALWLNVMFIVGAFFFFSSPPTASYF